MKIKLDAMSPVLEIAEALVENGYKVTLYKQAKIGAHFGGPYEIVLDVAEKENGEGN